MESIRNYVEALFAALPQREDVLRVKADMLANLEDKFNTLLDEGKKRGRGDRAGHCVDRFRTGTAQ